MFISKADLNELHSAIERLQDKTGVGTAYAFSYSHKEQLVALAVRISKLEQLFDLFLSHLDVEVNEVEESPAHFEMVSRRNKKA